MPYRAMCNVQCIHSMPALVNSVGRATICGFFTAFFEVGLSPGFLLPRSPNLDTHYIQQTSILELRYYALQYSLSNCKVERW